jgi:multidrug efflux pump subunit AcrA (membrane-fusion protein)
VIRAGLMGTAQVSYSLQQNGLTLPTTAVQEEGGKSIVWTIQDGLLKRQTVTLGLQDSLGLHVSILDGVKPTDHVLALRFEGLKEGAKAEVKP